MSVAQARQDEQLSSAREGGLPEASIADSVKVLVTGVVPALVRGLFAPRRWAMKLLTRLDTDARLGKVVTELRRKHPGQGARLLGGKIAVLWGPSAIKEVLDQSADVYASDSGAKAKGMCHFQPDALTLSRGEEWEDRRKFTEAVLATSERVHPLAEDFLRKVDDEVFRLRIWDPLDYGQFERMFDRLTLRVIFGDRSRDDQALSEGLEKLMMEANRLVGLKHGDDFYELYGRLERKLAEPEPGSLVSLIDDAPQTNRTRVAHQLPHWMFAMRDTLGANAYRALAAIVADPGVERRVREEIEGKDLLKPEDVDGLRYLEGCLHEAMRLWPTTPLLARETTRDTTLAGVKVEEGTQVMMLNGFNHRDPEIGPEADRLDPGRWADGGRDYRFNHLSNGSQDCPGGPLVLLLGKAVLARVLQEYDLKLKEPDLAGARELPKMLDFFSITFSAKLSPRG